jgi:hypothetical protein
MTKPLLRIITADTESGKKTAETSIQRSISKAADIHPTKREVSSLATSLAVGANRPSPCHNGATSDQASFNTQTLTVSGANRGRPGLNHMPMDPGRAINQIAEGLEKSFRLEADVDRVSPLLMNLFLGVVWTCSILVLVKPMLHLCDTA